jgi:hypothetical protein
MKNLQDTAVSGQDTGIYYKYMYMYVQGVSNMFVYNQYRTGKLCKGFISDPSSISWTNSSGHKRNRRIILVPFAIFKIFTNVYVPIWAIRDFEISGISTNLYFDCILMQLQWVRGKCTFGTLMNIFLKALLERTPKSRWQHCYCNGFFIEVHVPGFLVFSLAGLSSMLFSKSILPLSF